MSDGLQLPFSELGVKEGNSPTISIGPGGITVARRLLVDWDDLQKACAQLVGYPSLDEDNALTRYLPQEDWQFKGLYASQISRAYGVAWDDKDDQDNGAINIFKKAVIEVTFTARPYPILADDKLGEAGEFERFVEPITTMEGSYLTLPTFTGMLKWAEGSPAEIGLPFPGSTGKIVPNENYRMVWHDIPYTGLPEPAILQTVGKVNKTDFGTPDNDLLFFPAGTLLMIGGGWQRVFFWTPDGITPGWTVEYLFKYFGKEHNKFFNAKDAVPGWYQCQINTDEVFPPGEIPDGECVFDEAEFADLFRTDL